MVATYAMIVDGKVSNDKGNRFNRNKKRGEISKSYPLHDTGIT